MVFMTIKKYTEIDIQIEKSRGMPCTILIVSIRITGDIF